MTDNELLLAISNMIEPIREDIREIKKELKEVNAKVEKGETRMKKMELVLENDIKPPLNNIQACYTSTYDRYRDSVNDYETMIQDISIMKKVITEHSEKLQRIS